MMCNMYKITFFPQLKPAAQLANNSTWKCSPSIQCKK